jgi:glucosyl-dolichyl phosphate glucuronosyltransferase
MLSVVIPTKNRANLLQIALKSIIDQGLLDNQFEVLVVDNGSTDHTKLIVESYQRQASNVRYFYDQTPGLHVGRHRGLKEARGDILVYVDDDIEAMQGWLAAIADCFQNPDVMLVGGNNVPKFANPPPDWLVKLWQRPTLGGHAISYLSVLELPEGRRDISPYYVWGCNFSIRKQVVLDAVGFHPDGMPLDLIRFRGDGETHISRYVAEHGLRCVFDSKASVYHTVTSERMTFEYFKQRAFNQGISDSYMHIRNAQIKFNKVSLSQKGIALTKKNICNILRFLKIFYLKNSELKTLTKSISQNYQDGYTYHQNVYRDDPEVRSWVHKANYF